MRKKRRVDKGAMTDQKLAEVIRKAQEQPGLADLMALMEQSDEVAALEREQREAVVVTTVVSATATTS